MTTEFKKYIRPLIIIFLFLILAALLTWFAFDLRSLRRSGVFKAVRFLHHRRYAGTTPMLQPGQIDSWMTFRYINYVFHLPANYLQNKLNIADSGYPNITLNKYANAHKLNDATFVQSVRQAVTTYSNGGNQ
jgi:hypothetical protein